MTISPQVLEHLRRSLNQSVAVGTKTAVVSAQEIAAPPGGDPAMAGGAPPMDPAMAGGAPPMDPAMMDPAMMDPAMAGGAPPEEDPLIAMLENMAKEVSQTRSLVATLCDQLGVKVPLNDVLEAGEDVVDSAAMAAAKQAGYVEVSAADRDGRAMPLPVNAKDETLRPLSLDASCQYAAAVFARQSR